MLGAEIEDGALVAGFRRREVERPAHPDVDREGARQFPVVLCKIFFDLVAGPHFALLQIDLEVVHLAKQEAGNRIASVREA